MGKKRKLQLPVGLHYMNRRGMFSKQPAAAASVEESESGSGWESLTAQPFDDMRETRRSAKAPTMYLWVVLGFRER